MADHLVHVRRQLPRHRAPLRCPRGFLRRPGELGAEFRQRRLVVRLADVRQRHRLAAVLLADGLIVGQVDADGRHGTRVARFDHHVDGVGGDALDALLPVLRIPRHPIFEPLGVGGELLDRRRLVLVDVEDERFPRALDAPRIEIHLGEAVVRIDRRRFIAHPRDVVRPPILRVAGLIKGDQRTKRLGHRLGGERNRGLEVLDDGRYL